MLDLARQSLILPKRTALSRSSQIHPAINTLTQKRLARGANALQQLNINPWVGRKSVDEDSNARSPKRVTIHPYHPLRKEGLSSGVGKLVTLPNSIEKLLGVANTKFQNRATRVLSEEAAEVDDVAAVRDNDHLYVISDSGT